jgi:hypothetical protein
MALVTLHHKEYQVNVPPSHTWLYLFAALFLLRYGFLTASWLSTRKDEK